MEKPNYIYLQQSEEGTWSDEGVTWCRDKINNSDAKYISEEQVADMIDALIDCRKELNDLHEWFDLNDYVYDEQDEVLTKIIRKSSQALKKAGCTE